MRTSRLVPAFVILLLGVLTNAIDASPVTSALDYGPHPVGFRVVAEIDHSRSVQPRRSFDGQPATSNTAMALDIGIWYPADPGTSGTRMSAEAYKALRSPQPRDAAVADFTRTAAFAGLAISQDEAREALTTPARAVRDAKPASGKFPLVISGSYHGTGWLRAEYLASHGYVVVAAPSSPRTATLQASRPDIALETQTRNLEFLFAFARQQPFVDAERLGVIGVNFDGMAALVFEMRNMKADAVISLDGYEAKAGNITTVRRSPFFDPVRLRVPYLLFVQDEPDAGPALAHDRAIWNELRYSRRFWYVLRNFNHGQLISDVANAPNLSAEQVSGHLFILRTMRLVLDAYLKGDATAAATLAKPATENGLPAALAKTADARDALPPVPTGEEFEALITSGSIGRATQIFRTAKAANPELQLFDEPTIGLFAFRYAQRKLVKETYEVRALGAEAFPQSPTAAYQLGIAAVDAGHPAEARSSFERALTLLTAGNAPAAEREEIRRDIAKRLASLANR